MVRHFSIFTVVFMSLMASVTAAPADLEQARELIREMEYEPAIVLIEKHIQQNPDDIKAKALLAKTCFWDNNFERASILYAELIKLDVHNMDYVWGMANSLSWMQQYQQALPYYEQAWQSDKDNPEYWRMYILTLRQLDGAEYKTLADTLAAQARQKFPDLHWELLLQ